MKIAVMSDIHGNMEALEEVLQDIKKQSCDKIFCLGDYAMAGPEPAKTIDRIIRLQKEEKAVLIQGNTDLMIANYSDLIYKKIKEAAPVMAEALKDDSNLLNDAQKKFLSELPPQIKIEEEGIKILLVHGSPRKNDENIFPDTSMVEIEAMLDDVDADIVLCGHTHIPCGFQTSKSITVVNAGSVGRPFTKNPDACYLLLNINNGKVMFEHRNLKYNNLSASQKLLKRNFNGKEKLANMLITPTERHF